MSLFLQEKLESDNKHLGDEQESRSDGIYNDDSSEVGENVLPTESQSIELSYIHFLSNQEKKMAKRNLTIIREDSLEANRTYDLATTANFELNKMPDINILAP